MYYYADISNFAEVIGISVEQGKKLENCLASHRYSDEKYLELFEKNSDSLAKLIHLNDDTLLKNITLNLAGRALAITVLEAYSGLTLDKLWINDDDQTVYEF